MDLDEKKMIDFLRDIYERLNKRLLSENFKRKIPSQENIKKMGIFLMRKKNL